MGIPEIFLIGVGLSMDAFAVSIGKGLSVKHPTRSNALSVALWFGGFQTLMPLIGYFLAGTFASYVTKFDHWIAFGLLFLIGANMIREALTEGKEEAKAQSKDNPSKNVNSAADFGPRTMFLLAVATSIDALACGVSFAFLDEVNIYLAIAIIGLTTAAFSAVGLKIGNLVGSRFHKGAEILGGLVLIAIGLKTLLEHLLG